MYANQTADENHWKRIIQNTLSSGTANSTFFFYLFITQLTDAPCLCFTAHVNQQEKLSFVFLPWWRTLLCTLCCCSVISNSLGPRGLQHIRLLCPSLSPGVCSNSCPLNQWCHPTVSPSVIPFSSCLQTFPASGSFPVSQLSISGDQSIGTSASALVHTMNIQSWLPLGLTCLISLLPKGLSRVFSGTIVRKHQVFCAQPSLWSSSHIHTWLLEKP